MSGLTSIALRVIYEREDGTMKTLMPYAYDHIMYLNHALEWSAHDNHLDLDDFDVFDGNGKKYIMRAYKTLELMPKVEDEEVKPQGYSYWMPIVEVTLKRKT